MDQRRDNADPDSAAASGSRAPTASLPQATAEPVIPVSECFTSIQGEGALTGVPSFFVRTSGCNLRCAWCDTPYASWDPEGEPMPLADVVRRAEASGVSHVVLTGGEPLIQKNLPALARALKNRGFHITIETAGTVAADPSDTPCDLLSLSPKLANSTPAADDPRDPSGAWRERHERRRLDVSTLQRLLDAYPSRQFKFVVATEADLAEIDRLVDRLTGWRPHEVMLMPEGVTPLGAAAHWVAQACIERDWRYCHRVHIELFGDTRGT